jgi:hypothetical protein
MFHHSAYWLAAAAAATLQDIPAVPDTVFTTQNGTGGLAHFIYTDQLQYLGLAGMSATGTQMQIYSPSLIPYGLLNIWPLNASATPPSYPRLFDLRSRPIVIPTNEQIQFLETDTATPAVSGHVWIASQNWTQNTVVGQFRSVMQLTASVAIVAGKWSGLNSVTFTQQPLGGWYAVTGAWCLATTARAWRMFFPRSPNINGRQWRPGGLVSHAIGDNVTPGWDNGLGNWGAFHTFEPPLIEVLGDTTGAATQTLYLQCEFLGQGPAGQYPANVT